MSVFGFIWLTLSIAVLPFGYRPIVFLLIISSIFQASVILTVGSSTIPLFLGVELLVILRLILPYKGSGTLKFNDHISCIVFLTIILCWVLTYLLANTFEGLKVYSSKDSFEDSYTSGGMPLSWGGSNINQLILLSSHLLLILMIYKRRYNISKELCFKGIIYSIFIFFLISIIWKFFPSVYNVIALIMYNNNIKDIPSAFLEQRLSGTFSEPSYAGVYIAAFFLPFLFSNNFKIKMLGFLLAYLGFLNLSTSFIFSLLVSFIIVVIFSKFKMTTKALSVSIIIIFSIIFYTVFNEQILEYINNKSSSTSGVVRSGGNNSALNNFFSSYFLGIGVGSERASSLIINIFNNLGIMLTFLIFFILNKVITFENHNTISKILRASLFITFLGCFSAIPEYTLSFLWVLIFSNICMSNQTHTTLNES